MKKTGNKTQKGNEKISFERLRTISADPSATVHFVGIGGVSMYSLARLTLFRGASVSGSDREDSERTRALVLLGARVGIGHRAENVRGASLVVYTHAISPDNPELIEAKKLEIPIVSRAEYMGATMLDYRKRVGVSGSHGKSTTVAMLDLIFSHAGIAPTVLSGADLPIGEPIRLGLNDLMIYEACEYKDSFLKFLPTVSLGLNLELDHTDYFGSVDEIKLSFTKALGKATDLSVISGDDVNLRSILKSLKTRVVTFGFGEENDYRYFITSFRESGFIFSLSRFGSEVGEFEINIPGVYNVHNAAAAITVALEYGIDIDTVREAIALYGGIPRRLELIGSRYGRPIYYDYAHHPTEIAAAINALKMLTKEPLTVIFRPHTFSRTAGLWSEFCSALCLADFIIITDIYPAREVPIEGITSERLAEVIGNNAKYLKDDEVVRYMDLHTHGTIVLMGAGDLEGIKKDILKLF
nr:UDP-N-acetylmuramate--L-alanine ligase [Oscillospiraceae bacterium]